jgi:hypothetical protein
MLERLKEEVLIAYLGLLFIKNGSVYVAECEAGKALLAGFMEVIQDITEQRVKKRVYEYKGSISASCFSVLF